MEILFVLGTKAQFIKTIPMINLAIKRNIKVTLVDLKQHPEKAKNLREKIVGEYNYVEYVDNKNDIDGLCALISACDRVVSVDNATVHFAGALGKKCDVLLPFTGDWRWGMNWRRESYWYPSLDLHRQIEPWDWSSALSSLKLALEKK